MPIRVLRTHLINAIPGINESAPSSAGDPDAPQPSVAPANSSQTGSNAANAIQAFQKPSHIYEMASSNLNQYQRGFFAFLRVLRVKKNNAINTKDTKEGGAAYIFGVIILAGLLLLMFGTLQYTIGVAKSLENYYATIVATQQMQQNTPFKDAALAAGAWVAILHGFVEPGNPSIHAEPQEIVLQTIPKVGELQFTYDQNQVPNRVFVYFKKQLTLLDKFFAGWGPGIGLTTLNTAAQMGATSPPSFVSVHADVSISMIGPGDTATTPAIIEMLQRANIPTTTNTAAYCYPIDIADYTVVYPLWLVTPLLANLAMQRRCDDYRRKLPFYYTGERGIPINFNFWTPFPDPYDDLTDTGPGGHAYNPGLDYSLSVNAPAGDNMLTRGAPYIIHNGNICGAPLSAPIENCFPLANPNDQFSLLARPGYRLVRYDQFEPNCRNGTAICNPIPRYPIESITDPDGPYFSNGTNYNWATDQLFWTRAWDINLNWLTQRERNACTGVPTGPETPPTGGCDPQRGMLNVYLSDFFRNYVRLLQSFMITLSETVPLINFSVFSGATFWGFISNNDVLTGRPPSANKKLYDLTDYGSGTIFTNTIDEQLGEISVTTVLNNSGIPQPIPGNLSYVHTPYIRFIEQTAYLDRAEFPDMNPQPLSHPWVISADQTSYPLSQWLAPIENPNHFFVDPINYPAGQRPVGRASTYHLLFPGVHPSVSYMYPFFWDIFDTNVATPIPTNYFPPPANQVINTAASLFWTANPATPYDTGYDNRYDVQPLKQIDYLTGLQTGGAYTQETWIKNFATSVANYLTPTPGGTGTLDALIDACDSYKLISGGTGPDCGGPTALPGVVLLVSDGKPNQPCADPIIPAELTCDNSLESNYAALLGLIQTKLQHLEDSKVFVILLYIDQPALAGDPEVTQFKNLFISNPHRVIVSFSFTSTGSFTANFKSALSVVKSLIMQHTIQTLPGAP